MIFTERTIKVSNGSATIDAPIILYRGDRQVEILFKIIDSKYKFSNEKGNYIKNVEASFGQLAIDCPGINDVFTEVAPCIDGVVIFSITSEMIDEINEVGLYSFHIRLFNDDKTSRVTIPPIMEGIEIREPIIIEGDVDNTDVVGDATVGYSMVKTAGTEGQVFDEEGNYNATVWSIGDKITAEKLNKVETAIHTVNENITTTTEMLNEIDIEAASSAASIINETMEYIDLVKANCETSELINFGENVGSRSALSTFSGWGIPFRKENIPNETITGYSTYVTVYDNATDKNKLNNVELDLYLLSKPTLETERFSVVRKLATSVLVEPGEVKFDFEMEYQEWPDIFALLVYNSKGYNLMLNTGSLNSNYKDSDIFCVYVTGKADYPAYIANSNMNSYIMTSHKFYGGLEFKPELTLDSIPEELYENTSWDLPSHIYAVEGDTLEMFTTGMINSNVPYDYHMRWIGPVGALYRRKYMYTPAAANLGQTYSIQCELRDHAGFMQEVHNLTLHVERKPSNPSSMKTIMIIGDSLTEPGTWPHELFRRLTGTGGNPEGLGLTNFRTIGRGRYSKDNVTVNYEGYGGWNHEHYYKYKEELMQYWVITNNIKPVAYQKSIWRDGNGNNWVLETIEADRMKFYRNVSSGTYLLPATGTLTWVSGGNNADNANIVYTNVLQESSNPFWDSEAGEINVQKFVESQGASTIDYMICLLGWNNFTDYTYVVNETKNFVNIMHEQMPNMKIILCGLQVPNPDGCATNYGLGYGSMYANPVELRRQVALFNASLEQMSIENDFVYFVHISSQYDYEYASSMQEIEISKRCPVKISQCNNGIHPGLIGYMQIADAVYRRFVAILNEK